MFARSILRSARPQVLMATRPISRSVVLNKGAMDSLREKASDVASKVSDATSSAATNSNADVSNKSSTSDMPPELAELTDPHAGEKVDKVLRAQDFFFETNTCISH
ncbi:hypothetical protein [Phaffia rhodozyma]|uniref:Uncharacterized protein n=1 Tax=Phaffia rhodozyma TaxID=264483 RepID=A0A0F7SK29_PHARH|nr:hypothetical protein [Phaffia rhodozyma]